MAFMFDKDTVDKHRREKGKPEQERKYDEELEKEGMTEDALSAPREKPDYDPYVEPRNFLDWVLVKGKDPILRFLKTPTKGNYWAIYADLKPKIEKSYRPSIGLGLGGIKVGVKTKTKTHAVYGVRGGFFETRRNSIRELLQKPTPLNEQKTVFDLIVLMLPFKGWQIPEGLPYTYRAFEVWFRNQLGLPIPNRLSDDYQRLKGLLKPPEYPFPSFDF